MERRITTRDIARRTGVHPSTVSRALRDDPQVALATRELVANAARELGYTPDPMLRALALYRSNLNPVPVREHLAFLWPEQSRTEVANSAYLQRFIRGATARANELGYLLSEFFLREHKPGALERILHARGIRGILVGAFASASQDHLEFALDRFASAALGGAQQEPPLHSVSHDHYHAMRLALHELQRMGYRKVGFLISDFLDTILESRYSMSFLAYHPLGRTRAAKLLHVAPFSDEVVEGFLKRCTPEVLITTFSLDLNCRPLRRPDGTRVPLVSMDVIPGSSTHAGIQQLTEFNAANAVDLVAEQILHGFCGLPPTQKKVLSDGVWCAGPSCPTRTG